MNPNKSANVWLRSPVWDGFWIQSGLWLLVPVLGLADLPNAAQWLLIVAVLLLWLPHRFATAYNALCTPAYRDLIRAQWIRFCAAPFAIFAATFAFVFGPMSLIPWDLIDRVQILATIFFLYNSYHFAAQHFGVVSIYRIRANQPQDPRRKRLEKAFCVIVGGVLVALAQIFHGALVVEDSIVYDVVARDAFAAGFDVARWIAVPIVSASTVLLLVLESNSVPRTLPKMLYIAGVGLQGVLAYFLPPAAFLILWGVQHWLVSVALTAHMADNDAQDQPMSLWYRFWKRFNRGFWPTVFVLVALTLWLAPPFQFALHEERAAGIPALAGVLRWISDHPTFVKLVVWLNFATVYMHFVLDRAVFRFSNPDVRKVTGPLMFARRSASSA